MSWRATLGRLGTAVVVVALAFTYTLVFSPAALAQTTIVQGSPTSGSTDVAGSASYTDTLTAASGFTGTVSFVTSTSGFTVNGTDQLASTGTLSATDSPYLISGSDSDGSGDSGTWTYSLTVMPDTIVQGPPTSNTTSVAGSAAFTDTLTAASGFIGAVTFTTSTPGFTINGTDQLATTGTLSSTDSPYSVTGNDSDAYGDTGTWTYSLTVTPDTIVQGAPTSSTTDVVGSATFSDTLAAGSGFVGPVTFTTATPGFAISGGDELKTTGTLSSTDSPYSVTGNDSDAYGDTGTWTYSLTVTPDTIVQGAPTSSTTDVVGSATFSDTLAAGSGFVGPVTFTTATPGFAIASGDELKTTGTLSSTDSPYSVTGNDSDAYGDTGTWTFSLTVTPDTIVQGSPTSGSTNTASSGAFSTTLSAASGFVGPVTFSTSTPGFAISGGDELKTTGPLSASATPYTVTGTDSDTHGDTGTWTYTLTVAASGGGGGGGGGPVSINQTSATTGTVSTTSSGTFTAGPITVEGNTGAVTFVTTHPSPSLTVSSSGLIAATGTLLAGTYSVSGTDSDTSGDTGTWTYTLTVTAAPIVVEVTFDANGGSGTMSPESESAPTALSLNRFTRSEYTFVDWNTSPNGSGVSYANGATFPFTTATTLFAQWKRGRAPMRTITFAANGGHGTTASEVENTPTAVRTNHFTRTGFTFVDWNTAAKGNGGVYKPGATYPFKKSIILYAQWKKLAKAPPKTPPTFVVTFAANGGAGSMAAEPHHSPAALTPNHFTRSGYRFVGWNTSFKGTGTPYANDARYPFTRSITLYAQWRKIKVVAPPPTTIPGGVTIGPFAADSATLSPALKSQVQSLAVVVKTNGDLQITLYGFGDKTVPTNETNVALGDQRATAVATYLESQLSALGLKGWTISVEPASPNQLEYSSVIAELS